MRGLMFMRSGDRDEEVQLASYLSTCKILIFGYFEQCFVVIQYLL